MSARAPAPDRARLPGNSTWALLDPFAVFWPRPVADVEGQPGAEPFGADTGLPLARGCARQNNSQ